MTQSRRGFLRTTAVGALSAASSELAQASRRLFLQDQDRVTSPEQSLFRISPTEQIDRGANPIRIDAAGVEGPIEFWTEAINVAHPGFKPPGVEMPVIDPKDAVFGRGWRKERSSKPFVLTRGPETLLKLNTEDQLTEWKQDSERDFELTVSRPGLFRYQVRLKAEKEMVTVEARLENHSSWDWRDAYVYFHWGLVSCPTFAELTGERTYVITAQGLRKMTELRRSLWKSPINIDRYQLKPCEDGRDCFLFRPTAQYYEPEGRPMARTEDGFSFDMCGISPDRVNAGVILRQSKKGDRVLAATARRFRAVFADLSDSPKGSQCLHVNPTAGDLLMGETAVLRGAMFVLKGKVEEVAREVARRRSIPLYPPVKQ
jgi:hypothetical protein